MSNAEVEAQVTKEREDAITARLIRIESQLELVQETLSFFVNNFTEIRKKYGSLEPVAMALIRKYVVVDPKTKEPKIKLF